MPPSKRAAEAAKDTAASAKKFRSAIDGICDEWICPITTELPLNPVMAEDGAVYERTAIEEYIRTRNEQGNPLKSPLTNLEMGPRLTPSTQVRNTIEKLVRSGAISGDKAERWLERLSDEDLIKALKEKAEGGDLTAIDNVATYYLQGKHGLVADAEKAFHWFKKGADLGDPACMAQAGRMLLDGYGTEEEPAFGTALMVQAAMMGSKFAAKDLGGRFYDGEGGLPMDLRRAKYWYAKVATAPHDDLTDKGIAEAGDRMRELEAQGVQ